MDRDTLAEGQILRKSDRVTAPYHISTESPWRSCPNQKLHVLTLAYDLPQCVVDGCGRVEVEIKCHVDRVRDVVIFVFQLSFSKS